MNAVAAASDWLFGPFAEPGQMRHALVACIALALGSGPIGVFLVLRRMSLIGDTMAHAVLPGVAVGFLLAGMSLPAMSLGGFAAGLLVALFAGLVTRFTPIKEDASFAAFFVISLALGVLLVAAQGDPHALVEVLFGDATAIDRNALLLTAGSATVTLLALALMYRPLVIECFDPAFLRAVGGPSAATHFLFLILVVLNMVANFQALGTMLAVALMMLPAIAARFWAREVWSLAAVAIAIAMASSIVGLLIAYHAGVPSGAAIALIAGVVYVGSLTAGPRDSLAARFLHRRHLRA
jgi:zinc/manganese transport system permease protein